MNKPNYITEENKIRWHSTEEINKKWNLSRLQITFLLRAGDGFMGRFGGGWSWKLGVMGGKTEIVMELLFFTLRFRIIPKVKV